MGVKNPKHLLSSFGKELLRVPRLSDGLSLLRVTSQNLGYWRAQRSERGYLLQFDMPQVNIGDISDKDPPYFEHSLPFI